MTVELADETDLRTILEWLHSEYDSEAGEGFWGNRRDIQNYFDWELLWVVREGNKAVAFLAGNEDTISYLVTKCDKRHRGYGEELLKAHEARARANGVKELRGECSRKGPIDFWLKFGFESPPLDQQPAAYIPIKKVLT